MTDYVYNSGGGVLSFQSAYDNANNIANALYPTSKTLQEILAGIETPTLLDSSTILANIIAAGTDTISIDQVVDMATAISDWEATAAANTAAKAAFLQSVADSITSIVAAAQGMLVDFFGSL
jgi:hypothetical protein